jgi:O-methyltransferase
MRRVLRLVPHSVRCRIISHIVRPYTLVGLERIKNIYQLAHRIENEGIPGDMVECGVYNGGTAAILAHFGSHSKHDRTVWLFDSFQGMPQASAEDGEDAWDQEGTLVGNIEKVKKVLGAVDADLRHVNIIRGWFESTFPDVTIDQIALLNIDCDWYESVRLCFERFYDAVVPGGIISIDDYGHWPGCKRAVDEFIEERQLPYRLNRVDYTARWFQKL